MKKNCLLILTVLMVWMVAACSPAAQPDSQKSAKQQSQKATEAKRKNASDQRKKITPPPNSSVSIQVAPQTGEPNLPQLEDGPEKKERKPRSFATWQLQQKYPQIVALRGPLDQKRIALTFDDGPDRRFTPQVLDVLKKHKVKATFFVIGARAAVLPEVTKRMNAEGHAIGNHSYWHPNLGKETIGRIHWEASETDKVLQKVVGFRPKLFRPPYGNLTEEGIRELGKMNYSVIGWTVDSEDWRQIPAPQVIKNVMKDISPGAVILMHSGGYWTQDLSNMVTALDQLIPMLKKQGYTFVTVPELLNIQRSK